MRIRSYSWVYLICFLWWSFAAAAESLTGEVVSISDGDTLTLLTPAKEQKRIRLAEIDTPEKKQPYGTKARETLADLVFREQVRVDVADVDRYGRIVGRVFRARDGLAVNAEMIRAGAAWVYRQYNKDKSLLKIEEDAKAAKRGLWSLPEAQRTAPWEWRRADKKTTRDTQPATQPTPAVSGDGYTCGTKTTCGQMRSCEEAKFYLVSCGASHLDGNNDGVPCEALCR